MSEDSLKWEWSLSYLSAVPAQTMLYIKSSLLIETYMCLPQGLELMLPPHPPHTHSLIHTHTHTHTHSCRNFDSLIPDAPELIQGYLEGEGDASCKRNAFMMLIHVDRVGTACCNRLLHAHVHVLLYMVHAYLVHINTHADAYVP